MDIQIENDLGLVVLGTTAETPNLTDSEKEEIIKKAVKKAKDKIPIIVGTGSNSTRHTIEETKKAENLGADAVLIVTPYYNKPTDEGVYRHFECVVNSTNIPIIVYNVPARTGKNVSAKLIKRISGLERIIGIKEASGDINQVMDIKSNLPSDFLIFSGDDSLTLPMLSLGVDGVISVVSNLYPIEIRDLINCGLSGNFEKASEIHYRLLPFTKAIFRETNPIGIKYAMFLKSLIKEAYRLPMCEISEENKEKIRELLR